MKREMMTNEKKDNAVFRRTAAKSKQINLRPNIMRGGYRL